jgi:hypothetical protein
MSIVRSTADIREKMLQIWKLIDEKKITTSEARLHIGVARTILETLKVEIASAHLARSDIPSVSIGRAPDITMTRSKAS